MMLVVGVLMVKPWAKAVLAEAKAAMTVCSSMVGASGQAIGGTVAQTRQNVVVERNKWSDGRGWTSA